MWVQLAARILNLRVLNHFSPQKDPIKECNKILKIKKKKARALSYNGSPKSEITLDEACLNLTFQFLDCYFFYHISGRWNWWH